MLTEAQIAVIRDSLPAVGAAIDEITPIFYRRLFEAHPDLERDLFNRGNQAVGAQQRSLAASIAMYATAVVDDELSARSMLERVANKHASLGVAPAQYPVVHEHLFAAIVQVLGDAVTPAVAEAWTALYWQLADELITLEKGLYSAAGVSPETVWRTVVVDERRQETPHTVAFVLADPSGDALPEFSPGQYVSIAVRLPDGARQIRQYSLSGAGAGRWRIGVRRDGEVSSYLHEYAFEGTCLQVSPPFGDIVLDSGPATPLVLASAGIGITPVLGMLHHLAEEGGARRVIVAHADRTRATHAHRAELSELVDRIPGAALHTWYDALPDGYPLGEGESRGRIDLSGLPIPPDAHAYLCGPLPFMTGAARQLEDAGVPRERVWFEAFTPSV
ncbi:globin domain-containing protein [Tsukamurella ocularis]|uniref:globin domain-containing protein n=1 Tax=Tsukamurella ocularis TaxID=1970234 RepID=UPI0021678B3D|nr:globin domain-containing protein [Tsukamurella ocularis]MCS3779057.1 nitric oxide dioxygenase [Tsukamurella ocularis]MCS3787323.1 nitric oxide dioxygenase [Tsukamurella ocularis]MCS3851740.1 nitric oxide dioxygenase [Tsukamurella ocularis]